MRLHRADYNELVSEYEHWFDLYEEMTLEQNSNDVRRRAFMTLFETVGRTICAIDEELFDEEEDEDWADMNRAVMAGLLKQHQPSSMKE